MEDFFPIILAFSECLNFTYAIPICDWIIKSLQEGSFKLQLIRKRPQNLSKSSPYFWLALHKTKVRWRFCNILWPSQNIWTLNQIFWAYFCHKHCVILFEHFLQCIELKCSLSHSLWLQHNIANWKLDESNPDAPWYSSLAPPIRRTRAALHWLCSSHSVLALPIANWARLLQSVPVLDAARVRYDCKSMHPEWSPE